MPSLLFRLFLFLTLLYSSATAAVTPSPTNLPSDPAENIGVPLSIPFALKWSHPGAVGGTRMTVVFDKIISDARCPHGMQCADHTPVAVALSVYGPTGAPAHLVLTAHTDNEGSVLPSDGTTVVADTAHGYTFTLVKVTPYPRAFTTTTPDDYEVWLQVDPAMTPPTVPATPAPPTAIAPALDEPFDLHLHDQATIAGTGLQVQFTAVQQDSRCPADVLCAWSGAVGLEFIATAADGTTARATLGGYANPDGDVRPIMETGTAPEMWLDGYTIKIERILPYPAHHDQAIAPEDYVATLRVTKSGQPGDSQATPTPVAIEPDSNGLPVLCVSETVLAQRIAGAATEQPLQPTSPINLASLSDIKKADQICMMMFGEGWHVVETDDLDGTWRAYLPTAGTYLIWDWNTAKPVDWRVPGTK